MKFERYRKEHKKQFTALLLACTIMVTAVAATLLTPTAVAANTVLYLSPANSSAPTARQLRAVDDDRYSIMDEYDVVYGADTQVDIFKVTYENDQHEVTVAGSSNEKVIAPGTANTYTFALKNTGTGGGVLDYAVSVEAFVTGLDGTGKTLPVQARLQGALGWMAGDENTYVPVLEIDGAEEEHLLTPNRHATYTLEWMWPFEQDLNGDGSVDDGDALDTWLATQTQDISLTIRINVLYTYRNRGTDEEEVLEEELPLVAPVPGMLNDRDHYAYLYGFHDGTIRPEDDVTRAQVAAIFYRLLRDEVREEYYSEEDIYPDVATDAWYKEEIATLTNAGIFEGYSDGYFRGEQAMTRAEMAAILARLSGADVIDGRFTGFEDIQDHWAENEIKTIEGFNWIEGYEDGTFRPDDPLSRAETATMINRMLRRDPQKVSDLLPNMKEWPDNADTNKWYYLAMQEASNSHDYERLLGSREKWTHLIDNPWNDEYQVERQ